MGAEGSGLPVGGQPLETNRLFNLYGIDTFVGGKDVPGKTDSVNVVPADFTLQMDAERCVATNAHPVAFTVDGGTGRSKARQAREPSTSR